MTQLRTKYPRTYHFPWSPGKTSDDKTLKDLSGFAGEEVVITEKMDGENITMYRDYLHARSVNYTPHPSRSRVKKLQEEIGWQIPNNLRICGENLQATKSIKYQNLPSFFLVFSIWNGFNKCLSWDETVRWANHLKLKTVPVIYKGIWDESFVRYLMINPAEQEGYVVRVTRSFHYDEFNSVVGKYVRLSHVQTPYDWMRQKFGENQF